MNYQLEHHQVRTNGITLHVVQAGPADGPLVVLLHGFPDFWYGWQHQFAALTTAGYRVWAPDQRGYNLSDKPPRIRDYTLPTLAADILGLLDAAGREKASVIGHDWGGIVAWHLATYHAERFGRVAILNVPHPAVLPRGLLHAPRQLLKSWYVLFFQLPWLPEKVASLANWRLARQALTSSSRRGTFSAADLALYQAAWRQPRAMRSMINWYRALRYPAGRRGGPVRVTIPVQIIWGKRDAFLSAKLAELSLQLCDRGALHYFDQATHWVQHEEAAAVNELLVRFLNAPDR